MPLDPDHIPEFRSLCPISGALDLIGDKWTLLIVRDMIWLGCTRYSDFARSPEAIPTNILADRLKRMEAHGLITREPYQDNPPRYEYALTAEGRALKPVLEAMVKWGLEQVPATKLPTREEMQRFRA